MGRAWSWIRAGFLPVLAAFSLLYAVTNVLQGHQELPPPTPPVAPAVSPFAHSLAGAGVVEASTENIAVGSATPGVIVQVAVIVGQSVRAGDLLFRLDDRALGSESSIRQAQLRHAQAQLDRLRSAPRPEELPISAAKIAELEAKLVETNDLAERAARLFERGAQSQEELVRLRQGSRAAQAALQRAHAEHAMLLAGTWKPELDVAQAAVDNAQAMVKQTQIELDRLRILAPIDGQILQVNVRPGEYVGAPPGLGLVWIGQLQPLHVRVDVDEHDIPRFRPGLPARATVRGASDVPYALTFVRVERMVVPKKSLTGDNTERVDTRVLQAIYAVNDLNNPLYVGQQLDVSIDLQKNDTQ